MTPSAKPELCCAADQEPTVRALFNELLDGFISELGTLLEKLKLSHTEARIDLLHALIVGLSIIDLATRRKNGRARAKHAPTRYSLYRDPPRRERGR
jgi:hypothetical protein